MHDASGHFKSVGRLLGLFPHKGANGIGLYLENETTSRMGYFRTARQYQKVELDLRYVYPGKTHRNVDRTSQVDRRLPDIVADRAYRYD